MGARYPGQWIQRTFIARPMASGTKSEAVEIAALVLSRWIVMMRRAILALATLIALGQTAAAGVPLFGHVSCAVVRFYVAKYSEAAAEKWARGHGAGDAEIEMARRCLHGATVQTASLAAKSQALAPVTEPERAAQHEPAERDPDQDALHVVPVQAQRADPGQDNHDNEPAVQGFIAPKDVEDRSGGHASNEIKEDPAPSDAKTATSHPRYVGAMHRAGTARVSGHVAWFKRLWNHLTRPRPFRVAVLHFSGSRR
jgi:hypothetical protein